MAEKREESPHYIPELDPQNHDATSPAKTFLWLLLVGETWLILGLGGAPVLVGLFGDQLPDWLRIKLVIIGVFLSLILVLLFIRTNKPPH